MGRASATLPRTLSGVNQQRLQMCKRFVTLFVSGRAVFLKLQAASADTSVREGRASRGKQDGGAFGDDQRVFEMGGDPAIARAYGPAIFVGEDAT